MTGLQSGLTGEISQIGVHVKDLERARQFYGEVLGLPLLFEVPGMVFYQCGTQRLMLSLPNEGQPVCGGSILYFDCVEIEAACRNLEAQRVEMIAAPSCVHRDEQHEIWMCFFKDPFGHVLALTEQRAVNEESTEG